MDHEYIDDIAAELELDGGSLEEAIDRLGIETLPMAVPPYGAEVSSAVRHEDAERLRSFLAKKSATSARG